MRLVIVLTLLFEYLVKDGDYSAGRSRHYERCSRPLSFFDLLNNIFSYPTSLN